MKRRADDDASQYSADDIIGGEFYDLAEDPQEWHDLYGALDEDSVLVEDGPPATQRDIRNAMIKDLLKFLQTQHKLTDFMQNGRRR